MLGWMPRKSNRTKRAKEAADLNGSAANDRVVARNRRATYQYEILKRYEAGLELLGSEIKSIRLGRASIAEAYCRPRDGELWLVGAHIPRYEPAGQANHEPVRDRRLLLHKRELRDLQAAFEQRGLTLVPIALTLRRGLAKLELGIGRGKRQYEKRQDIAKRDADRDIQRALHRRG